MSELLKLEERYKHQLLEALLVVSLSIGLILLSRTGGPPLYIVTMSLFAFLSSVGALFGIIRCFLTWRAYKNQQKNSL